MMTLCSLFKYNKMYKKIFRILKRFHRMPDPCSVTVLDNNRSRVSVPDNVLAFCDRDNLVLWFRKFPPDLRTYTHEILHLIEKPAEIEETVSYNLSDLMVMLAEMNVKLKRSPVYLVTAPPHEIVAKAREFLKAHGYPFRTVTSFLLFFGILPHIIVEFGVDELPLLTSSDPEKQIDGENRLIEKVSRKVGETVATAVIMSELIAMAVSSFRFTENLIALNILIHILTT